MNLSFNNKGLLNPGDYILSIGELKTSLFVIGPTNRKNWDRNWRFKLVSKLEILASQLWQCGIEKIYVDGSFVEEKDKPNDIDGYFECPKQMIASGDLANKLNELDNSKIWTWNALDRMEDSRRRRPELPMRHKYGVELYPHYGQSTNVVRKGQELIFPKLFRISRNGEDKGIVLLKK